MRKCQLHWGKCEHLNQTQQDGISICDDCYENCQPLTEQEMDEAIEFGLDDY